MKANCSEQKVAPVILVPAVKNYSWGKIGKDSFAARLLPNFDASLPYAELWYGSHPSGPSTLKEPASTCDLPSLISENPKEFLGARVIKDFGPTLPFLIKILSIQKALSIQLHPSIKNARILNAKDPKNYPDSNHKPEVAIALSEVKLLHGWISKNELLDLFKDFPAIDNFLNKHKLDTLAWCEDSRKELVKVLFECSPVEIAALNNLLLKTIVSISNPSPKQSLFIDLSKQFELSDVGLLLSLFLRQLCLKTGESIFTPAGEIHAYLSGEMLECMANSDNVIRAGLTPKFQDVASLIEYGNFSEGKCLVNAAQNDPKSFPFLKYYSMASEFEISTIIKSDDSFKYSKSTCSPELLLLFEGEAKVTFSNSVFELLAGDAILIPAIDTELHLELKDASIARVNIPE